MKNKYKIIAYHTNDELYNAQIKRLKASLAGYNYYIQKIEPYNTWDDAVNYKPEFILKCLNSFDCNLLYLDADAVVRSNPVLLDDIDCDLAVHHYPADKLFAGTLYLRNCPEVKQLVIDWIAEMTRLGDCYLAEQTALDNIVSKSSLRVHELPPQYALIFDVMKKHGPAVIEHFQASRGDKKRGETIKRKRGQVYDR